MKRFYLLGMIALLQSSIGFAQHVLDLSGPWKCYFKDDVRTDSVLINLPGSTDEIKLGVKHEYGDTLYTGESERWQFARKYVYIGEAEYERTFVLPENWIGKRFFLSLERCLWTSRLFLNGKEVGEQHSLSASHDYDVTDFVKPGVNQLSICIDNRPFVNLGTWSHAYSQGMQSVWNGIIGKMELSAKDRLFIEEVNVWGDASRQEVVVKSKLVNSLDRRIRKGKLCYSICEKKSGKEIYEGQHMFSLEALSDSVMEYTCRIPNGFKTWDEFDPNLYEINVELSCKGYRDYHSVETGFRKISTEGYSLKINDNIVFLRGEHDGGFSSVTGYPSMDTNSWVKIFNRGKDYGLNHWRFHSWCPPEAAFKAADSLGIYLQVELPLFPQPWENTLIGKDKKRDDFLFNELKLILRKYGNHPSFVLMSMGNEMKGDSTLLKRWVAYGKKQDDRHLYTSNSNPEAMGLYVPLSNDQYQVAHASKVDGVRYERRLFSSVNNEKPGTSRNYSHTFVKGNHQVPVISHEIGQWCIYPDFRQIDKFGANSIWSPNNLRQFKEELEKKGMGDQAHDFMMASGKLAASVYKEDMERCLRTPELSGFHLLDLRDYPCQGSALVGLLDVFWDNKGIVSVDEFKSSCNDVTLLLEMDSRTWKNDSEFKGRIVIPNYSNGVMENCVVNWQVEDENHAVRFSGSLPVGEISQGMVFKGPDLAFSLSGMTEASMLTIRLELSEYNIKNEYKIWIYPATYQNEEPKDIIVCRALSHDILKQLSEGAKVLFVPENIPEKVEMTFSTPMWSTLLFENQARTLGTLCNPGHPLFKNFPTEKWSDWQWWELTRNAFAVQLNGTARDYRPILQVIDDYNRNDKLGAIMETQYGKGRLLICTLDIVSDLESRYVAKQLRYSIMNYMNSKDFAPVYNEALIRLFVQDDSRL